MSPNENDPDVGRRKAVLAAAMFVFVGVVLWAAATFEGKLQAATSLLTFGALAGVFVWKVLSGKSDVDEAMLHMIRAYITKVQSSWRGVRQFSLQLMLAAAIIAFAGPLSRYDAGVACAHGQEIKYAVFGSTERTSCGADGALIWSPFRLSFLVSDMQCTRQGKPDWTPYAVQGKMTCIGPCDELLYLEWGTAPTIQCGDESSVWEFDQNAPVGSSERCKRKVFDFGGLERELQRMARVERLPGLAGLSDSFQLSLEGSLHIADGSRQVPVRISYTGEETPRDGQLHVLRHGYNYAFARTPAGSWCHRGQEVVPAEH